MDASHAIYIAEPALSGLVILSTRVYALVDTVNRYRDYTSATGDVGTRKHSGCINYLKLFLFAFPFFFLSLII